MFHQWEGRRKTVLSVGRQEKDCAISGKAGGRQCAISGMVEGRCAISWKMVCYQWEGRRKMCHQWDGMRKTVLSVGR